MSTDEMDIRINILDQVVTTYNGVNIYQNSDQPFYYFTLRSKLYRDFESVPLAEERIDGLLIVANPSDSLQEENAYTRFFETYRGVNIYQQRWVSSTGAEHWELNFRYKGVFYRAPPTLRNTPEWYYNKIDEILGGEYAPEQPAEELPEPYTPPPVEESVTPDLGWLQGIATWFGNLTKWFSDTLGRSIDNAIILVQLGLSGLGVQIGEQTETQKLINTTLSGVGEAVATGISAKTNEIIQKSIAEALMNMQQALPGAVANSPEWKQQIEAVLNPYANQIVEAIRSEVNPARFAHSPISPEEAKNALNLMSGGIIAVEIGLFVANAALEGATLGQVEAISQLENMVVSKLGLSQIASAAFTIPAEELVLKKARQYYAAEYTPEIPNYSDLINMLVKEKISREDFTRNFAYLGFEKRWADLIWDSHFQAPNLNDILTAWRRGDITEERVNELMILVDLDPAYKSIFDTRKYVDPSLSLSRFMFETGSINEAQVRNIISRNGYRPDDVDRLVDFVVHFQERRYRQRYLTALATGYARGVVDQAELSRSVLEAGYTQGTADWIVKSADIRKEIASRGSATSGPKLMALGDLKKAYTNNLISEDQLRTELQVRDYQTGDIEVLIDVLDLDKAEVVGGKKVVALSTSEMINAFRYGVWTEDQLRTELMVRGLSLDEVNTLIRTKKAQWGVASQQGV